MAELPVPGVAVRRASILVVATLAGCATKAPPETAPPPAEPVFYMLAVPATFDSTMVLARLALQEVNGVIQHPRYDQGVTSITTHYARTRSDGGETRVAIVLEVSHKVADPSVTVTGVRLSAWALDYPGDFQRRAAAGPVPPRRVGLPTAANTTSSPSMGTQPLNSRPRAITDSDDFDVRELLHVVEALMKLGARKMP